MKIRYLMLIGLLFFPSNPVFAEEGIKIIAVQIDGVHQADFGGSYDVILTEASGFVDTKYTLNVMSPEKAFSEFEKCTNCCLSPVNKNSEFYNFPPSFIASDAMNIAKIYVFSKPGTPAVTDLGSLKGRKVVARSEMPYGQTVERSGLSLELAATDEANIDKLKAGSADAMIAYVPDAYMAFESKRTAVFPYVKDRPIAVHPDSVLCKPETGGFVPKLNVALGKLRQAGRIKSIMGIAYIPE